MPSAIRKTSVVSPLTRNSQNRSGLASRTHTTQVSSAPGRVPGAPGRQATATSVRAPRDQSFGRRS